MGLATTKTWKERILRVLVHVQQHLDDHLELGELARLACFSPWHFHRIFRGLVGESVMSHIRRLRLERAAHRLRHTDRPVIRIAMEAGYESHAAFTRAFGAQLGEAPSAFRDASRPPAVPASPVAWSVDGRVAFEPGEIEVPDGVRIWNLPERRCAFARCTGPYAGVSVAWAQLTEWARAQGTMGPNLLGLVHDDPEVTPAERLRYDACLQVGPEIEPAGDIGLQVVAGGPYAVLTHVGPYDSCEDTYRALVGAWAPTSGRELRPVPFVELYLNDPRFTAPADLRTEICLPLEP